jgi:hypothetical protein
VVQLSRIAAHQPVIAIGKQHEHFSQVSAAGIAQPTDVFDCGERVLRVVSYREVALIYGSTDKRASSLFVHDESSFVVIKLNYSILVAHGTSIQQ